MIFVDFEKVFDSVDIDSILKALVTQSVELPYVHLLTDQSHLDNSSDSKR